jgi:rfaE bifunctional protein nucleotidyltransferase chain/domain
VQRLKGPTRPITPLAQRMEVLSALACVDYVVAFGGATPQKLIERLKPDILVKGADWVLGEIVGREIVEQYGGRVARIRMVPGVSTTELVRRIIDSENRTSRR